MACLGDSHATGAASIAPNRLSQGMFTLFAQSQDSASMSVSILLDDAELRCRRRGALFRSAR
jgi:hypothetical protein